MPIYEMEEMEDVRTDYRRDQRAKALRPVTPHMLDNADLVLSPAQVADHARPLAARLGPPGVAIGVNADREFIESVVDQRTTEIRGLTAAGDFTSASVLATQLGATLDDAHERERSWEIGEGLER